MEEHRTSGDILAAPSRWFSAMFLAVLLAAGLISVFLRSDGVSAAENRVLAPVPTFSVWSLFSGSYTDSLELYYADNFPLRDEFVYAATSIRDLSGYHKEIVFYKAEAVEPEVVTQPIDTVKTAKRDTLAPVRPDTARVVAEYDRSSSVVIYGNRAIQLFTASTEGLDDYVDMINLYRASFESLDIFCLVAPTQTDFYLPDEYKKSSNYEDRVLTYIELLLDSGVNFVDAHSELSKHTREYIYFNTDHHWTGRGAYYAYVAFCRSAGIKPYPLDSLERRQVNKSFLGSLYAITLDKRLRKSRDSVEYFRLPIPTRTFRWNKESGSYEFSRLFVNAHNYTNFIGGDHPMMRIESDVNSDKILVIKDSYGNAVVPFLALHYGTVYVMDYRYFDMNVRNFVRDYGITALMFLNNTFAANSKFTSYRGRYVLNWRAPKKTAPAVQDSTTTPDPQQQDER
jgi:hypothetical protein